MACVDDILDFWFWHPKHPEFGQPRPQWFRKDPKFDQEIRDRFLPTIHHAAAGTLSAWQAEPLSCVALLLCLDQFPRNTFRGTPQAFATDTQALAVAQQAIDHKLDQGLPPVHRWFMYLPFEHSESWAAQQQSLTLWQSLQHDPNSLSSIEYAQRHAAVIQKFGRFPHRNAILGRVNTPEERAFLAQPGSSF